MKNPAANFGIIIGEGTKRARRAIGLGDGGSIEGVHPNLSESAALLSRVSLKLNLGIFIKLLRYLEASESK